MRHRIGAEVEVAHLAHVAALHVADDHGGIVRRDHTEQLVVLVGAGEIQDIGSGFQAGARDGGLVGLHRNQDAGLPQLPDDRQELAVLPGVIHAGGLGQSGFGAHINDVRPLRAHDRAAADGAFGGKADTLAIPRVRREIDHAHDRGPGIEGKWFAANGEFLYARLGGGTVSFQQFGKVLESQHGGQYIPDSE